ncbi:MAG: penicillin acylase family protein, partial [Flavobacteriaceae bacterium]|nr:penicillin acylase family protein [Flavobacteriaceae bacterium]
EEMRQIKESIAIKGKENREVTLRYTRHGPVTMVDTLNHKAYAVRCAWLEPGGSPYLASLRMDQAKNWEEFRDACSYSHIPGENMIWADKEGNIGWQAVGIAPIRPNFSGLVPVPGDGTYEWEGYLPIKEKPHDLNPGKGYIATANQNVIPEDYEHWNAVGYTWADPYRGYRIEEVLSQEKSFSMEDMKALQVDYVSIPARKLTPLILNLQFTGKAAEAQQYLRNWDHTLGPESIPAAIYVAFENTLGDEADAKFIPEAAKDIISYLQMKRIIDLVTNPDDRFGSNPEKGRDEFLHRVFIESVSELENSLGPDIAQWQYGQAKFKHSAMVHSLGEVVNDSLAGKMNLGPLPRGGNSYTPGSTGGNKQQSSGASFRIIVNSGDWDATEATNAPGQSGDPESDFYDNLFESWAKDEYFPVYFSDKKVDSVTVEHIRLLPAN